MTAMEEEVDDRFAGIDIDSLLNRTDHRPLSYGRKKALYEAPEFIQRLNGEETVLEGQSLCIECKIRGFPVPTLRWFKDDEEILDHPRIHVESNGTGGYCLIIDNAHKGDEAAYRCRAENVEGACSSFFFLSVKSKPKSQKKKDQKNSSSRRTVSFPPMFATIVEKVEEEEKQGKEFQQLPPSPMTDFYYAMTLKGRQSWPTFLGDWAFVNGGHSHKRRNSTGSINTDSCECSSDDDVFSDDENDDDEGEPPAKKPFFFLAEDTDSSDSSPTESITVFNSNIHARSQGHKQTTADLQNNNDLARQCKEVLDNEREHVTELRQSELDNLRVARQEEDSKKLGCSVEGNATGILVPFPGNLGDITPPIVVELWDEFTVPGSYSKCTNQSDFQQTPSSAPTKGNTLALSGYEREEREPTPFFRSDDTQAETPHSDDKSKQILSLIIPDQNLSKETAKEFHRELTPFYENKNKTQPESTDISADFLGVPDPSGIFQRESTPFYKEVSSKSQTLPIGSTILSPPNFLLASSASGGLMRDSRESTPYYNEKDPYEYIHHPDYHFSERTLDLKRKSIQEDQIELNQDSSLASLHPKGLLPLTEASNQTFRPKLQQLPHQDLTLGAQAAIKSTTFSHSKPTQPARSSLKESEHKDSESSASRSPETLASEKATTWEITNKSSLFTVSADKSPILSYDSQQPNNEKLTTTGQTLESDKQNDTQQPFTISKQDSSKTSETSNTDTKIPISGFLTQQTSQTPSTVSLGKPPIPSARQDYTLRQQRAEGGELERKLNTDNQETAKNAVETSLPKGEHDSANQTQKLQVAPTLLPARQMQIRADKLSQTSLQESETKTPIQARPESSKVSLTGNKNLETANQTTGVCSSNTENEMSEKRLPNLAEDLRQKMPLKGKITTLVVQAKVAPVFAQETQDVLVSEKTRLLSKPANEAEVLATSKLSDAKTKQKSQLDDQISHDPKSKLGAIVNPEVKIMDLITPKISESQSQATLVTVSATGAAPRSYPAPDLNYPNKSQETKVVQQDLTPRHLIVSAKNIYPTEIFVNESQDQATRTVGSTNQSAGTPKAANQSTGMLTLPNQTTGAHSDDTAVKIKKNSTSGFSSSLSTFFRSKRKTDEQKDSRNTQEKTKRETDEQKVGRNTKLKTTRETDEQKDSRNTKEKSKRSVFTKTGSKHKSNMAQPVSTEVTQETPQERRMVFTRQTLTKCSPFGPYTLEGCCFLFVLTIVCLHFDMSIEKFVCYVLAAFYTFCVMRILGVIF